MLIWFVIRFRGMELGADIEPTRFGFVRHQAGGYSGRSCRASRLDTPAALAQMAERRTRNA